MKQPFAVTVLPGGRKVRDFDAQTVEAKAEAAEAEAKQAAAEEKKEAKKTAKKAEDESLG